MAEDDKPSSSGTNGSSGSTSGGSGAFGDENFVFSSSGNNGGGFATSTQSDNEQNSGKFRSLGNENSSKDSDIVVTDEKSVVAEMQKARELGVALGINDNAALEKFAQNVGNKTLAGESVNLVQEVKTVAGPMAAALAQFELSGGAAKALAAEHISEGKLFTPEMAATHIATATPKQEMEYTR